jgi:hypothetical protein
MRRSLCTDFIQFAAADKGRRVRFVAHLKDGSGHIGSRAAGQLYEFKECFPSVLSCRRSGKALRTFPANAYEQSAFCGSDMMLRFRQEGRPAIIPAMRLKKAKPLLRSQLYA